jgi:hypothetical protein
MQAPCDWARDARGASNTADASKAQTKKRLSDRKATPLFWPCQRGVCKLGWADAMVGFA